MSLEKAEAGRQGPTGNALQCSFPDVMMPSYSRNPWSCVFFIVYLSIELYFIMNLVSDRVSAPLGAAATVLGAVGMEEEAPHRQGLGCQAVVRCGVGAAWQPPWVVPVIAADGAHVGARLPRDLFFLTADVS